MRHSKERFHIDDFFNYPASSGANPLRARSMSVLELTVLFVAPSTSAYVAVLQVHNEILEMLLENRAEVNSWNYCGQTAFMQACQHGHWEVQTVLLFRSNGTRVDYMSGSTALHFVAMDGNARCMPYGETTVSPSGCKNDQLSLGWFIYSAGFTDPNQCSSSIRKSN